MDDLAQKAISEAIKGNWESSVLTNLQILDLDSENLDALNRLGRAYSELGKIKKAKEIYKKALKLDPYNSIATKCLEKMKNLPDSKLVPLKNGHLASESFIEEPGKTKIAPLINLGDKKVLASLSAGEKTNLLKHPHKVSVAKVDGRYIGRLPDDLASEVKKQMEKGVIFACFIREVKPKDIKIFLRLKTANKSFAQQ